MIYTFHKNTIMFSGQNRWLITDIDIVAIKPSRANVSVIKACQMEDIHEA